MSETTRTFVAIAVPEPLGRELAALQALLATEIPGFRWPDPLSFHITLAFLGDVHNNELADLCDAVNVATGSFAPFELHVQGLGAFPTVARASVIWAGIVGPNLKSLMDLREAVVDAISEVGRRPADMRFHPHVTLGRMKPGRHDRYDLNPLVERYQGWSAGTFPVAEVTTFASTLGPGAPIYTPIGRAPLKSE
jgi:2'-5' RNA ligase